MAGQNFLTANSYFGLALETTRSVAAAVGTFTPVESPKVEPMLTWIKDQALRGSPVMDYDEVPATRHDVYTGKVFLYHDVFPQILRAALGSTDTVASVAPSTWTHTIGLLNQANTGSQPPSYTIINDSVDNTYQMTGSQLSDFSLSLGADKAAEATINFIGNPYTTVASVSVSESTAHLMPGWDVSASVGGASVAVIETFDLNVKRNAIPIFTLGSQAPYRNWAGPIEVSGKFMFVVESGEAYNANALTRDQQQIVVRITDPVTSYYTQFQMSAVQLEKPTVDQSKSYIALETEFVAVGNTTDAVNGGYSPIQTITQNGILTSY